MPLSLTATTVTLGTETQVLSPADLRILKAATDVRLLDLHDGLGVDLQAFVPRLGGWTQVLNFGRTGGAR